jgi:hypothetical protein
LFCKLAGSAPLALALLAGCGGSGAEGLVRWSAQRCQLTGMVVPSDGAAPSDASVPQEAGSPGDGAAPQDAALQDASPSSDGGGPSSDAGPPAPDASAPSACEARLARVANTVLPQPRPDPRVLKCYGRVTGAGAERQVEVGFEAVDSSGARLTLRGLGGTAVAATRVGSTVSGCLVELTESGRALTGQCGAECTVTITAVIDATQTIQGRIRCPTLAESGTGFAWRVFNAEGVPGDSADFSVARCDAPAALTR